MQQLISRLVPTRHGGGLLTTRRGTVAIAAAVAAVAAAILFAFITQYGSSIAAEGEPAPVLVANGLIPKGSSGDVLAAEGMVREVQVRKSELVEGALTQTGAIRNQVAAAQIVPGQQLQATDFTPVGEPVGSKLAGGDRAVAIPVDAVHGLTGPVQAGTHVDVLVGFNAQGTGSAGGAGAFNEPVVKKILDDILVLRAPGAGGEEAAKAGEQAAGNVVLRVPARFAPHLVFAAENGVLSLSLRPGVGARETRSEVVTLEKVLLSAKPVALNRKRGNR